MTRPKQTLESRSSRARTLAPDVKPCRDKRVRVRARFVRPRLLASSFASSNEPSSYSPMGRIATTMKDRDARYYKLLDLVTLATDR